MSRRRLFLLDGLAMAYRSHFAFIRRPLTNTRGEVTSAVFAFANTVVKLRDQEKPDLWALTWDSDLPTRRHKSYPVTDTHGKVIGMVSRADALRWLGDEDAREKLLREQVEGQELVVGYDDELAGHLADRMSFTEHGRVPILNRASGALVGLVARRDLLRVRTNMMRHEHEREALIRVLPRRAP